MIFTLPLTFFCNSNTHIYILNLKDTMCCCKPRENRKQVHYFLQKRVFTPLVWQECKIYKRKSGFKRYANRNTVNIHTIKRFNSGHQLYPLIIFINDITKITNNDLIVTFLQINKSFKMLQDLVLRYIFLMNSWVVQI